MTSKKLGEHATLQVARHRWSVAMARIKEAQGDIDSALYQRAGASKGDWGNAGHRRLIAPNFQIDRSRRITAGLAELARCLTPEPSRRVGVNPGAIVAYGG